jgi:predicted CXXCH cytochrome family protein
LSHPWRPVFVVLGIIVVILVLRYFLVPPEFGIGEAGYMYGWHNKANEKFWLDYEVKHKGNEYCEGCHPDKLASLTASKHAVLKCENCHGPAFDHPSDPPKLPIPKGRAMCLRCHVKLPYPTSLRAELPGFLNPEEHNPGVDCSMCHNPHNPNVTGPGSARDIFNPKNQIQDKSGQTPTVGARLAAPSFFNRSQDAVK